MARWTFFVQAVLVFQLLTVSLEGAHAALVGQWKFDQDFSDSVGTHHGAATGTGNNTVITPLGQIGGAAGFDGNDDRIVISQNVVPSANVSVSFWEFSPTATATPDGYFLGVSANDGSDIDFFARRITAGTRYAGGITQSTSGATFGEFDMPRNTWNHSFITHDASGNGFWYVNGELKATLSTSSTFSGFNYDLIVGNRADLARDFHGSLDDLAIWNTPLGGSMARALYELGLKLGQHGSPFDFNYDAGKVEELINSHALTTATFIGDDYWDYATNLNAISGGAQPGELFIFGGETYLLLSSASGGTGMLLSMPPVPEPNTGLLLVTTLFLLPLRRGKRRSA